MTALLWLIPTLSLIPRRLRKASKEKPGYEGQHRATGRPGEFRSYDEWTPTGESESARIGSANADSPVGHNADVPAAAAETAGGRNSDQSVGD